MKKSKFLPFLLFLIIIVIPACDEKILTGSVDCSECYDEKPDSAALYVHLTFADGITEIPLVLYNGTFEDGNVDYIDTAWIDDEKPYWVLVKVDKEYAVKAEYRFPDKTLYAVDGTQPVARHVSDVCDYDCWVVVRNELNLEIKAAFRE